MSPILLFSVSLVTALRMNQISTAVNDSTYVPKDHILVDCGASGRSSDGDNRTWVGDVGTEFEPSSGKSTTEVSSVITNDRHTLPQVPYRTSRMSRSRFIYSILISSGCKFLRLYFNPSAHSRYSASNALFNVTASGNFTLLANFNPSVNMSDEQNQTYHIREFSINTPSSGYLDIVLTPCRNTSHAFINGIEIVSMPDDMFVTAYPLYDSRSLYAADPSVVLETSYRLNVGGVYVPPAKDSGEFRGWYDDTPYVYGDSEGIVYSKDSNVTITYSSTVPRYIAPSAVYGIARSKGSSNSNLTWSFLVDSGYHYWIRLHFCEIKLTVAKKNERVFSIFVNNRTADAATDVIDSSTWVGTPVYRDFVAKISNATSRQRLSISLAPTNAAAIDPTKSDPILNGMEIFKLRRTKGIITRSIVAASAPKENGEPSVDSPPTGDSNSGPPARLIVGLAVVGGLLLVCTFSFAAYLLRRRARSAARMVESSNGGITLSGHCRHFRFAEMVAATHAFDESCLLGVGGFGKVYLGTMNGGSFKVAIKRGNPMSKQGIHEFRTQTEMLSKLRHRHLVSLIGYCEEKREMVLVYDYMPNGSLREHLYRTSRPSLPWKQRLEICIGAARGLHYLHTGAKQSIIHRDVKTTNILLDENLLAKVSDFGLSKIRPTTSEQDDVSTVVKGSFGYIDPEYVRRQRLTEKSDVYSFGVVLFEVLCARPPVDSNLPEEQVNLANWALECRKNGTLDEIVDPYLKAHDGVDKRCLEKFVETAENCLADKSIERPSMANVLWNLEVALQLQVQSNARSPRARRGRRDGVEEIVFGAVEYDGMTSSGTHEVFSAIRNQEGR